MATTGPINGFFGSRLRTTEVTDSRELSSFDCGRILAVDASAGDVVLTLPSSGIPSGWFAQICLISSTGAVSVVAGSGAVLVRLGGGSAAVSDQWGEIFVRRMADGQYLARGDI